MELIKKFLTTSKEPFIVILGPTASGKTAYAIEIAKQFNGEIISADSRQIYKYMDIGTAKPSKIELESVPHHLIDSISPDQTFSAFDFKKRAEKAIKEIQNRGKIPILCGGTGLYIDTLTREFSLTDVSPDEAFRKRCLEIIETEGNKKLFQELQEKDPLAAAKIHPHNTHHLIRALEVLHHTGKSKFSIKDEGKLRYNTLFLGLDVPRVELYERINKRAKEMVEKGLIEETKKLLEMGYSSALPSLSSIGYQEVIHYLNGKLSYEEMVDLIQKNTRHYAKRQMTWFRRNKDIQWITV